MRTRTVLPVVGTVAAVTAVAVTVALVQPDGHAPRPLRLAAGGAASGVARDSTMSAPSAAKIGGSGYTLTGALPAGQPDDAPAYTLPKGPADVDVVQALAKALDAGTPVRDGAGWRAGGLFVSGDSGQSWWWSPCAADTPVASDSRVACAYASGGATPAAKPVPVEGDGTAPNAGTAADAPPPPDSTSASSAPGATSGSSGSGTAVAPPPTPTTVSPVPEPDPMPKDEVRAAAKPVFDALGLDLADARVDSWPYGGSVTLTRTVGGLEAYGLQTSVQVGQDGTVQGAGGWLGVPDKGDSYPLVTAQDAYDALPPMASDLMCPVGPDGQGCAAPEPIEVTGAHLGLMVSALADGGQALVPAWLFEVKGWTEPMPVVAVQAKYLPSPSPEPTGDPGSVTPVPPGEVPPAPPAADPGVRRATFAFDKVSLGDKPDQLIVTYGDSSSCVHDNVTAAAKEDAQAVYVVLESDARDPSVACTEDYHPVQVTVTLQAPLGDRKVYDASTMKVVAVTR